MPPIGFGTWEVTGQQAVQRAVGAALEAGYRLIDTAKIYGNERAVGAAIRASGIPREELLITTKLWNDDHGYERTLQACRDALERLGLDYLDLYLIHWPATRRRLDSWRAFEKLLKDGLIRAAGVSNYTIDHLQELQALSSLTPAVNQVEFHPFIYEQQRSLLDYCREQGIAVEAYSPLNRLTARPPHAFIEAVRHHAGKTPQQVALRWCIQHDTVPLPRSRQLDHIRSNFEVFDFKLSSADMEALNALSDGRRVTWDPAGMGA